MRHAARGLGAPKLAGLAAVAVLAVAGVAVRRAGFERVRRAVPLATRAGTESRAYRLKPGEPVPEGLTRIARGRIDHALDELRGETDNSSDEAVHEARKDLKKLRSLLRLVRGELGDQAYRRENDELRDIGRSLGGLRDADVVIETLDGLVERYPGELSAERVGDLRGMLAAHRAALADDGGGREAAMDQAAERLSAARARIDEWQLADDRWKAVGGGLRRAYRRGRRRMRAAEAGPTDASLHEWRKRAKDLWYQLTIIRRAWPAVLAVAADEAHALSESLGEDHDLAVLSEQVGWRADAFASREDRAALERAIERRREELRATAFERGRRLYAERPRDFARRIASYWESSGSGWPSSVTDAIS